MADLHSNLDFKPAGTERQLIVGYRPHHGEASTPSLTLSGKWLREAGFDTGRQVSVKVMDGCIVLMTNSDKEQALAEELKQAKRTLKEIKGALVAA
ncbi:SymE family type I addiction module toxin [Phytobacter diazotrophicus]|jgi:toxic protein SymE|uniref:SymE family type I addiction module toxin n=1 Tax=Phytobacter diazotrophicus TaxID=395631 RepID=UPI002936328A|nr:SymE family type I addiction module toxin [Phytobacter diazotrophicus]MDV2873386.1 SymE family type I addiction module toxin [Phytobacter diazotrophicus]